ncbi:hypothetical protein NZK32_13575 [Cyanobium sp. FGCU-52]|nr:hypothetical protein [Cyanobium sp. FGCU52]
MKRVNSHYLLIVALLGLSTLFDSSYPLAKAQSEPKPGCQATVDKILQEIRSKGVNKVSFRISKGTANKDRIGNPTNRTDELLIVLDPNPLYKRSQQSVLSNANLIEKILESKEPGNWADYIVSNCSNTAIVSFLLYGSDYLIDFYVQSDGTTKFGKCGNKRSGTPYIPPYSWGISYCAGVDTER